MTKLQVSLYLETDGSVVWAPEGPGWYLDVRRDAEATDPGVEIVPRIRLTPTEAVQLGQVFDKFADGKPLNWTAPKEKRDTRSVAENIEESNIAARAAVERALEEAEQAARRVAELRRQVGEFE